MKNKFAATCSRCGKQVAALAGETNMHAGKWVTEHATQEACKSAVPGPARSRPNFSGSFYGSAAWSGSDYYDDDDNPYGPFSTSEDVNPNEGSK
jgi:hypothetical protein